MPCDFASSKLDSRLKIKSQVEFRDLQATVNLLLSGTVGNRVSMCTLSFVVFSAEIHGFYF